jgi:hypothetical protein
MGWRRWARAFGDVCRLAFLPIRNLPILLRWLALLIPLALAVAGLAAPHKAHLTRWQILTIVFAFAFAAAFVAAFRLRLASLTPFPKVEIWLGGASFSLATQHPETGVSTTDNQKDVLLREVRITSLEAKDLSMSVIVFVRMDAESHPRQFEVKAWPVRTDAFACLSNPINIPAWRSAAGDMRFFRSAVHDGNDRSVRVEVQDHHSGRSVRVPEFGRSFRPHEAGA